VLKRFISGNNGTIIATSLLGLGVDVPGVDVVLYLGAPRLVKDYA